MGAWSRSQCSGDKEEYDSVSVLKELRLSGEVTSTTTTKQRDGRRNRSEHSHRVRGKNSGNAKTKDGSLNQAFKSLESRLINTP